MSSKNNIFDLFVRNKELTVSEIVDELGISKQTVHIALNRLVDQNKVEKLGRAPKTVYRLREANQLKSVPTTENFSEATLQFLKENFLMVTETGTLLEGIDAFARRCQQRKLPVAKTLEE